MYIYFLGQNYCDNILLTRDNNGQPISDKCIIDTIIGKRVTTKDDDSINEYESKTALNNAVLNTVVITSFCKYSKFVLKLHV